MQRRNRFEGIEGKFVERFLEARRILDEKLPNDKIYEYSSLSVSSIGIKKGNIKVFVKTRDDTVVYESPEMHPACIRNFKLRLEEYLINKGYTVRKEA